jgi:hypothetical protein
MVQTRYLESESLIRQPNRIRWLKWLRRIHAWLGLWGLPWVCCSALAAFYLITVR